MVYRNKEGRALLLLFFHPLLALCLQALWAKRFLFMSKGRNEKLAQCLWLMSRSSMAPTELFHVISVWDTLPPNAG